MFYFCEMRTKDKIVATALHLFNTQGTDLITVRHIAQEMGISHGNLCYHFPRKEDIIFQLYLNLVGELDGEIARSDGNELNMRLVMDLVQSTFAVQYRYRFILTDFVAIMRSIPAMKAHFHSLFIRRKSQFSALIAGLVQTGYFLPEQYAGQHDQFIRQFYILGDFWIAESEILYEGAEADKLNHYTRLANGLIFLHLTDKGRKEMQAHWT
jgi:AcrR family transcriptional regulator